MNNQSDRDFPESHHDCVIVTPPGRLGFVAATKPLPAGINKFGQEQSAHYKAKILIAKDIAKKSPNWQRLGRAMQHYMRAALGAKASHARLPRDDGDEQSNDIYAGCWILHSKAKVERPPQIYNADKSAMEPELALQQCRSGALASLIVSPWTYTKGNGGCALNLKGIWIHEPPSGEDFMQADVGSFLSNEDGLTADQRSAYVSGDQPPAAAANPPVKDSADYSDIHEDIPW